MSSVFFEIFFYHQFLDEKIKKINKKNYNILLLFLDMVVPRDKILCMNTTKLEKIAKVELLQKTWEYLNDNFHKFTEENKIRIALALAVKMMPTQIEGNLTVTRMNDITIANRIKEFDIGDD